MLFQEMCTIEHLHNPWLSEVCLCAFTSVLGRVDELTVRGEYEPSFVTESHRGTFVKLLGRLRGLRMESDS